jgi:hypothetical protein
MGEFGPTISSISRGISQISVSGRNARIAVGWRLDATDHEHSVRQDGGQAIIRFWEYFSG